MSKESLQEFHEKKESFLQVKVCNLLAELCLLQTFKGVGPGIRLDFFALEETFGKLIGEKLDKKKKVLLLHYKDVGLEFRTKKSKWQLVCMNLHVTSSFLSRLFENSRLQKTLPDDVSSTDVSSMNPESVLDKNLSLPFHLEAVEFKALKSALEKRNAQVLKNDPIIVEKSARLEKRNSKSPVLKKSRTLELESFTLGLPVVIGVDAAGQTDENLVRFITFYTQEVYEEIFMKPSFLKKTREVLLKDPFRFFLTVAVLVYVMLPESSWSKNFLYFGISMVLLSSLMDLYNFVVWKKRLREVL